MTPPRVLLVRFSAIGDILLTTPLIRALRRRHPDAHLAALTRRRFVPLLADNPHLDAVHALEEGERLSALAARLGSEDWTHLLDLHGSLRSLHLRLRLRGRWRGYPKYRRARWRLVRTGEDRYPAGAGPVAERYFAAAEGLDVEPDGGPPEFGLGEPAVAEARAWLGSAGLGRDARLVALAPGAAHATKRWPAGAWASLAGALAADGHDLVVVGGPDEAELAAQVAGAGTAAGGRAASAAGTASLQVTGALIAAATALVSGDTGVMHMATGVGTPVVALFGPTVRQFGFLPYQARATVLERNLPCRPCSYHGGPHCPLGHHRCLRDIGPDEVLAAVTRWAGRSGT